MMGAWSRMTGSSRGRCQDGCEENRLLRHFVSILFKIIAQMHCRDEIQFHIKHWSDLARNKCLLYVLSIIVLLF